MTGVNTKISSIGWRFNNTYAGLPDVMLSRLSPVPVKSPKLIVFNHSLSKELGLDFSNLDNDYVASLFSGNSFPEGSQFIAQAYAGHQFGYFTVLGDGRAILIGEHLKTNNDRVDIQLKGSGQTPYSRNGDGRAALGPVLREYIISEAMHALGIPSTRSLAVVTTGEDVIREKPLQGGILTRVATSHIRVGTFQYIAMLDDLKILKNFVDYTNNRHFPNIKGGVNPALALLKVVMERQIYLITNWMRVGFIHGVMNTDNMTISGETIDYGPCAFMDVYNPETVFSSIDHHGRYAYCNQPSIAYWNLLRFAETLLPLIHNLQERAAEMAGEIVNSFGDIYKKNWINMMCKKIGLFSKKAGDEKLINTLLSWMHKNNADYTNTFCDLLEKDILKDGLYQDDSFINWHQQWLERLKLNKKPINESFDLMRKNNPLVIPRNHKVEEALNAASINNDLRPMNNLLKILKKPYDKQSKINTYRLPPEPGKEVYKTFCGT